MNDFPTVLSRRAFVAALAAAAAPAAFGWTRQLVRMLVPAPPGGTIDIAARLVSESLAADIGASVIAENKPGAGGAIAVQALRSAPPDGQTLMMTASNVLTEIPLVLKTGFDPMKDLQVAAVVARTTMVLVADARIPARTLDELIAYLKQKPGAYGFASYSPGSGSQYAGMIFNRKAGLDLVHVPFAGSPPALTQVIGGSVPIMFDGLVTSRAFIQSGKLRAFAVAAPRRTPLLPDVPTFAELGYPELDFSNPIAAVLSSTVPQAQAERIHDAMTAAAHKPALRQKLAEHGFDNVEPASRAQLAEQFRAEYERNAQIVSEYQIRLD